MWPGTSCPSLEVKRLWAVSFMLGQVEEHGDWSRTYEDLPQSPKSGSSDQCFDDRLQIKETCVLWIHLEVSLYLPKLLKKEKRRKTYWY